MAAEYEQSLDADLRHADAVPAGTGLVAFLGEQACGCVALVERDARTGIVKRLYVPPLFRGHGVARTLMAALIARARERGYTRIVLDTNRERLHAAYRLYLALGFTECAPYDAVEYRCPTFMELLL